MQQKKPFKSVFFENCSLTQQGDESQGDEQGTHSTLPWQRLCRMASASIFCPAWLPVPWNTPLFAYGSAIGLCAGTTLLTWFFLMLFPDTALWGIFIQTAILVVALFWGIGPGLVATLLGTLSLDVILLSPVWSWSVASIQSFIELGAFLIIGIAINLLVNRIVRAQRQITRLMKQLEQEKADAAMQARQLSILFEAVPDAITVFDAQGQVVQMNEGARQLLARYNSESGVSAEQQLAQIPVRDANGQAFTEQNSPTLRLLRGEILAGGQAQNVVLHTFENEELWLHEAGAPIYDEQGHLTGAVAVTRDLTEQHYATQQAHETLHSLLKLAEALVQAGITPDQEMAGVDEVTQQLAYLLHQVSGALQTSITVFEEETLEPRWAATHGLSPEQQQAWHELRPGFTIKALIADLSLEERVRAGEETLLDLNTPALASHQKAYRSARLLLVPMQMDGRTTGIVTFSWGDDAHSSSEESLTLARALTQLAALTLERSRLFEERAQAVANVLALRETARLMDEFIGLAGHELRTPLTSIRGNVELARRHLNRVLVQQDVLPEDVRIALGQVQEHLERTERQIRIQNRLIGDLLDVARVHTNRLELHSDLCNLTLLVRESVEDQRYVAPSRSITLTEQVKGDVLVRADAQRVRQVLTNYLSNAVKYSEAKMPVAVALEIEGDMVRVSVKDEGPGLSSEQQQRIWERFYRDPHIEVKTGSGVGLGLGLHIGRMIIERLDGQIGVQSQPGAGSTFWFTLPLAHSGDL